LVAVRQEEYKVPYGTIGCIYSCVPTALRLAFELYFYQPTVPTAQNTILPSVKKLMPL